MRFRPTISRNTQMSNSGTQSMYLGRMYAVIEPAVIPKSMLVVWDIRDMMVGGWLLLQLIVEGEKWN